MQILHCNRVLTKHFEIDYLSAGWRQQCDDDQPSSGTLQRSVINNLVKAGSSSSSSVT